MGFADSYLKKHRLYGDFISRVPNGELGYSVVIPCYDEDGITKVLDSLWDAERPRHAVEVIVVVNASDADAPDLHIRNRQTVEEIEQWVRHHQEEIDHWGQKDPDEAFQVHTLHVPDLPAEKAGAGLARKIGMDEAVARFNRLDRPEGWIFSLDADTTVEPNYFTELERTLEKHPPLNAGIFHFEHTLEGNAYEPSLYEGIIRYELFLRYYNQALRWAGYPYAFQTIGSAFCVRAEAYTRQGGMNTKRAGEDFYFLNKVFQLGHILDITGITVWPSPRPSSRVLFGTGPEMIKWSQNNDQPYLTYHPDVFRALKTFMDQANQYYKAPEKDQESLLEKLDPVLRDFLTSVNFRGELHRINNNCNSLPAFRKHFFHWFNGLRIIRFIHTTHEQALSKIPLHQAAAQLLEWMGQSPAENYYNLLQFYREIEKRSPKIL
ncbi:MAG: hypothetical protein KGY60_12130 [Bacteroidales bacterium]|nr:hypothetical protein [Bacteroidales bacterium]